jgi:hypothetical protein
MLQFVDIEIATHVLQNKNKVIFQKYPLTFRVHICL